MGRVLLSMPLQEDLNPGLTKLQQIYTQKEKVKENGNKGDGGKLIKLKASSLVKL